jgi:methylated-DNA-[protein]-cysteine S-methyltransferase
MLPGMNAYTTFPTAFGPCALSFTDKGVRGVELPSSQHEAPALLAARLEARGARPGPPSPAAAGAIRRMQEFFAGQGDDLAEVPLDLPALSPLHLRTYQALRQVKKGQLVTYKELAARAGSPAAVRAIGQAMAKNPCPILVPCHRVLAAGGKIGGFSCAGGILVKARLLVFEGVRRPEELLAQADPTLGRLIRKVGPFPLKAEPGKTIFYSLARSIAYQQLAGKAAQTIWGRVEALFSGPAGVTPQAVQAADPEQLRGAGLSQSKTAALLDLAAKALSGVVPEEDALQHLSDAEIVARLTQVRGIGPWSVEMLLMFRMGRLDVLPVSDYGVRKGFQLLYGLPELPTPKALLEHGERWRPFRSVASWYMWRVLEVMR